MTFGKGVKKALKHRYPEAFSNRAPERVTVMIIDSMSRIKSSPKHITTVQELLQYIAAPINQALLSGCCGVYFVVDKGSPPVKALQCHRTRDKNVEPMPDDTTLAEEGLLPEPWNAFTVNRKLVRRELYPLVFKAIYQNEDYVRLGDGQWVVINGLPAEKTTELDEEHLKLHRAYIKERRGEHVVRQHLPRLDNHIKEADTAVLRFADEHRRGETVVIHMNDGDIIPIALLNTFDRISLEDSRFVNELYLCLPGATEDTYVDVNTLFALVQEDPDLKKAGVQNPVLALCCLIILAGNDFVVNYCKGLSVAWKDATKTKEARLGVVWETFFKNARAFSHLFQLLVPVCGLPHQIRLPAFDEKHFINFTYACYRAMYHERVQKKHKEVTPKTLQLYCSSLSRPGYGIPTNEEITRILRHLEWNVVYWLNSHRPYAEQYVDPYMLEGNLPYYGFQEEKGHCQHAKKIAASKQDVDEVYTQHFKRGKKQ